MFDLNPLRKIIKSIKTGYKESDFYQKVYFVVALIFGLMGAIFTQTVENQEQSISLDQTQWILIGVIVFIILSFLIGFFVKNTIFSSVRLLVSFLFFILLNLFFSFLPVGIEVFLRDFSNISRPDTSVTISNVITTLKTMDSSVKIFINYQISIMATTIYTITFQEEKNRQIISIYAMTFTYSFAALFMLTSFIISSSFWGYLISPLLLSLIALAFIHSLIIFLRNNKEVANSVKLEGETELKKIKLFFTTFKNSLFK